MKFPLQLALRHLKSPQKGSFSTFAGVMAVIGLGLGIAALILTFSILEGFELIISEKIAGFDGHIRIQHFMDQPLMETDPHLDSLLSTLSRKDNRKDNGRSFSSSAYIQKPALLRSGSLAEGVVVEGIDQQINLSNLSTILVEGNLDLSQNSIIIGKRLADQLRVKLGDQLVLFDLQSLVQISSAQRLKQFTLTGLFHSGLLEYDKSIVYVSLPDAQFLFGMENHITGHMLTISDKKFVKPLFQSIESELMYPYYVQTWKDKHRILFDWITVQKWPILIIFGLIAFVGVVNIISALAMIVFEKIREIGTLLALGLSRKKIQRLFLVEGAIIGCFGSLLGSVIAVVLSYAQKNFHIISIPEEVYFMDNIPIEVNWGVIALIFFTGVIASVLASLGPTITVGRIEPAVALRYE